MALVTAVERGHGAEGGVRGEVDPSGEHEHGEWHEDGHPGAKGDPVGPGVRPDLDARAGDLADRGTDPAEHLRPR